MIAEDFDCWRRDYDHMSFSDHVEFYRRLHEDHPIQSHYNSFAALSFLERIPGDILVTELGGYDGALARECIAGCERISQWHNFDLSTAEPVLDFRYAAFGLEKQFWEMRPIGFDVFVASHVIEHLSENDFRCLASFISNFANWVYFDSPLQEDERSDWHGKTCAHKLELSWLEIDALMNDQGYSRLGGSWTVRTYKRP